MLAVLLASMEISIIATALPTIAGEFDAFESFAWVGTAYIAAAAIGTPLLGKLSDLYGRRRVFLTTMGLFIVGSFLCGIAQSMGQLIAARAVQGFGGGAIQALAFAILGDILPPRERGRYIGYFTLAFVGAALLGPLIGGFIIDHWTWPWIFFINIPLAGIATVVSYYALRLPFPRRKARLDVPGALLLSLMIGTLMIGLEEGGDGWTQPHVIALFAVSAVGLVVFIAVERRATEPMIPLHLFANPVVLACVVAGMCAGTIAFGAGQFLPLYFQDSLFVSPTESGLRMLPQMLGVTLGTFGIGRLILWTGRYKMFPVVGHGARRRRAVRHRPDHGHDAVPVAGRPDDRHGLRDGVGVHDDVDRHPERRRVPRPRGGHRHDHVLPHARRVTRARRLRHDPQRHRPSRDPRPPGHDSRRCGRPDP